jgi:hypothetical protein
MARVGYRHVHLDAKAGTVWFDRPGVELDPGRHRQRLRGGPDGGRFEAQGGTRPPRWWRVRQQHLRNGRAARAPEGWAVDHPRSVATFEDGGRGLSQGRCRCPPRAATRSFSAPKAASTAHIMDPRTGYPAQGTVSVSVVAPRTIDSEAWAKPYFVNGRQWAAQHKPRIFAFSFAKTGRISHARGSNDKPLFGRLPPPAHRCAAGLVHAAGRPLPETVPADPRKARHPGDLQAAGPGRDGHPAAGGNPGRGCRHHLRRPAAAGRADGAEAAL